MARSHIVAVALVAAVATTNSQAAERAFAASLNAPDVQAPESRFADAMTGDPFAALFTYGDSEADATEPPGCDVSLQECEWVFSGFVTAAYGAVLDGAGGNAASSTVSIFVQNDRPLPPDEAEFFGNLIGEVIDPGTQVDAWLAEAVEDDAFFIFDDDLNEMLANGVRWQIIYLTRDTSLYSEPSRTEIAYRPQPPAVDEVELAILLIEEADSEGNVIFFATAFLAQPGPLFSSLLPTARAVQVGDVASAFATIANASSADLSSCGISPASTVDATFRYQTTDPASNELTGTANTSADIPAGAFQTYALFLTPTAAFDPTEIVFDYSCSPSGAAAGSIAGVNTLLLFASDQPVADIVALAASAPPGQLVLDSVSNAGAFSVATVNVGAPAVLTVSAETNTAAGLSWCRTDPDTAVCVEPAAATSMPLNVAIGAGETPTFGIFAFGDGNPIPFDPAVNRVYLQIRDGDGNVVGETSVAISGP